MKKASITSIIILNALFLTGYGQTLEWAYSLKDKSVQNFARHMASNGKDFVINASVANVSYDFVQKSTSFNGPSNVIAKYNSKCEIAWVAEHPGGGNLYSTRILMMDQPGNIYACGRFSGTLDFDPTPAQQNVTASAGSVYIQKLDKDGKLVWVGHMSIDAEPIKMAMKSNGNIVVAGRSQDSSSVKLSSGATVKVEKGVFLIEFGPTGDALNAYAIPTPSSFNNNVALVIDKDDHIYVGASIEGIMNLDLKSGNLPDTSFSGYDVVIAKYDKNFNYVRHRIFGDKPTSGPDGWDAVNSLAIGEDGYLYASGWFTWTTDFDPEYNPGLWVKTASTKSQSPDGFIIKFDTASVIQWIQEAGGHASISGNADVNFMDMIVNNGSIIVYGMLNGGADFDGSANDFILKTADNGLGICLAQYTTSGSFTGAWLLDGKLANESPTGIEKLDDGIVAYGTFQKKLDADLSAAEYFLQTDSTGQFYNADNDLFLVKYKFGFPTQSIRSSRKSANLHIYPNPSTQGFYMDIPEPGSKIRVYSMKGILVYESITEDTRRTFIPPLVPGQYLIQVISNEQILTGKAWVR